MFSESPSFFVLFVWNHGALNLRLHVVALPASVTMSWPAKTTKKVEQVRTWLLNSSLAKFLILVLQSSNSLNLNAFFNFASIFFFLLTWFLFSFCSWGLLVPLFCSPCQEGSFWFFLSEIFKRSLDETHVFGRSFIFCICFYWWSLEFAAACGTTVIVSYHVTGSCG